MGILYLLVAFIVLFFSSKKIDKHLEEKGKLKHYHVRDEVTPYIVGAIVGIAWPLSVPAYYLWKVLEQIDIKLTKNKEK